METLNPFNIQRSLGEIRCLFCFCLFDLNWCFVFCSCTWWGFFVVYFVLFCFGFFRNKNGLRLLKLTPICQGGKEAFGLIERFSFFFCKVKPVSTCHRPDGPRSFSSVWRRELSLVLFQFWLRRRSRSLFLPSCAGWCRSLLRCIQMCDVHLVCTYVHNYVKILKIYFE